MMLFTKTTRPSAKFEVYDYLNQTSEIYNDVSSAEISRSGSGLETLILTLGDGRKRYYENFRVALIPKYR